MRRSDLSRLSWAWLLLALVGCAGCAGCAEPEPGLSVVVVVVDTMRADHLSVYGSARPTTPALARWAERGAVFEHAFATSPWTVPSMASLLTGQIPTAHGAGHRSGRRHGFTILRPEVDTLAQLLSEQGYETAAIVNNVFLGKGFGLHRGFAHYDHAPATDLELRRAPEVVALALDWLRQPRTVPSFLLVHLMDPHIAYDPPPAVRGRFTRDLASEYSLPVRGPAAIRKREPPPEPDRRFLAAAYDEELLGLDQALEHLLNEIEGDGLLSRSLVLVTSDHGEEFFEHGGFEHGHSLYQELLRVPFILWGPGVPSGRYREPVSLVDVLPTVLEAAGVPVPEGLAGRSLWGLVMRGASLPSRDLVAESMLRGPERRVLVRWPHKLDARRGVGRTRLFDLEADPHEQQDLSARRPELVAELRRALEAIDGGADADAAALAPVDEGDRERLAELGYVE